MNRLRIAVAAAVLGTALVTPQALADPLLQSTTTGTTTTPTDPTQPQGSGVTVAPTPAPAPSTGNNPPKPDGQGNGGKPGHPGTGDKGTGGSKQGGQEGDKGQAGEGKSGKAKSKSEKTNKSKQTNAGAVQAPGGSPFGDLGPVYPSVSCGTVGAPPALFPIYQRASDAYGLGPQGPGVLAAINGIESGFGVNMGPSSAGAIGWMQFLPSTWAVYGVDANGDSKADPYDPQDAIYAAARYLRAAGMPADPVGAIFAYNHADWYVAEVLANAGCYGSFDGTFSLTPGKQVMSCTPGDGAAIPERYMQAFEQAASQYDLGRRGVWALAGVARLESNYGRGMSRAQLRRTGPLGLDRDEWNRFEIDGNGDGLIRRASIEDSAATLARLIWSRGELRAGLFLHNQASWYVDQALVQADQVSGRCRARTVEWNVALPEATSAPINWANLTLSNSLEVRDIRAGALDPRIMSLLGMISQTHSITIASLRSDHSMTTVDGYVSNHYYGRAVDIAAVDGVPCTDTAPTAPCGVLGRTLTLLPAPVHPTELIYCFDLDGPGPAFARADHCDHLHVGFDG